jgi:hypothetical protein
MLVDEDNDIDMFDDKTSVCLENRITVDHDVGMTDGMHAGHGMGLDDNMSMSEERACQNIQDNRPVQVKESCVFLWVLIESKKSIDVYDPCFA